MKESGRNRREWIKTAAIIFLSLMLVLTFFSSTIQNWSLPEVATQYVQSGTITAKATITGTVESVDPYEVKVTESRIVAGIAVRKGDAVQKGDVLIYLEDKDSKELDEAKNGLDKAKAKYSEALLNGKFTASDIAQANKDVAEGTYRNQITGRQNEVDAAEAAVKAAENAVADAEASLKVTEKWVEDEKKPDVTEKERVERLIKDREKDIAYNKAINDNSSQKYNEAKNGLAEAQRNLDAAEATWSACVTSLQKAIDNRNAANGKLEEAEKDPSNADALNAAKAAVENAEAAVKAAEEEKANAEGNRNWRESLLQDAKRAFDELDGPRKARESNILLWQDEIARLNAHLYEVEKGSAEHEKSLKDVVEAARDDLEAKQADLKVKQRELKEKQEALDDMLKSAGNISELQGYLDAIDEAQKKVDELAEKAGGATITAPISGTVSAINVKAGNETSAAVPVAVMQREGEGFTLKYSASNDIANRLSVGDVGDLINAWKYDDVKVTLESIRVDPDSRGQNKLLTFNVTGSSVVAGQSLSFTVGQKSANYNFIVPNSAVREDNNGKFILIVTSKPSPLGTRYTASRVDVQIIASDETQSAVSGALQGYEFVITTSTKPVQAGSLVRLPD